MSSLGKSHPDPSSQPPDHPWGWQLSYYSTYVLLALLPLDVSQVTSQCPQRGSNDLCQHF